MRTLRFEMVILEEQAQYFLLRSTQRNPSPRTQSFGSTETRSGLPSFILNEAQFSLWVMTCFSTKFTPVLARLMETFSTERESPRNGIVKLLGASEGSSSYFRELEGKRGLSSSGSYRSPRYRHCEPEVSFIFSSFDGLLSHRDSPLARWLIQGSKSTATDMTRSSALS